MNQSPKLSQRPQKYQVGPGMTLYAVQTDRFKVGMLSLSLAKQMRPDLVSPTALLRSTLKRGTERYPDLRRINTHMDELYASSLTTQINCLGDREIFGLTVECLDSRYLDDPSEMDILDGCADMMAQMLLHPLTDEDGLLLPQFVDSERVNLCDAIRAKKNSPQLWAHLRLHSILYENEPCGAPLHGTAEEVMTLTRERLRDCHREWLEEGEMIFFYIGPASADHVCDILCRRFAEYKPNTVSPCPPTSVLRRATRVRQVTEDMAVSQGRLLLGFRTGITVADADYYAMAVANEIFGASPVSKLFTQVREKKSLCYSIGSSYALYKGVMTVSCGIDPDARDIAYDEIMRQWDKMCRGEISDEELTAAKRSLDNSYRTIEDNPHAIHGFYYGRLLEGVDMTVEDCRVGFAAVTREDIIRVASGVTLDTVYFLNGTCPDGEGEEDDGE